MPLMCETLKVCDLAAFASDRADLLLLLKFCIGTTEVRPAGKPVNILR
jgi:hypothetical protein